MGLFDRFRSSKTIASNSAAISNQPLVMVWDSDGAFYPLAGKSSVTTLSDGEAAWMSGGRQRQWRDLKPTEQGFVTAYMTVVWAYRGINIYVQKVAEILAQGKVVDGDGKEIKDHPFQASLDLTYRKYEQDLWEDWIFWKALTGEAYIEKVKANLLEALSIPSCFRVHNSLAMEPDIRGGKVVRYSFNDETRTVHFEPDEIIFDRLRNPTNDMRGYSLLGAAIDAANIDRGVVVINKSHLKNNARPGLVFSGRQVINETDMERIREFIADELKGPDNAGGSLFMPGPFEVTTVDPPSFGDQDVLTNQQKRRISAAIGIPVGLVDHEDAAFQLGPEKAKALYDLTLFPAARRVQRVVNAKLLPFIDRSSKTKFEVPFDDIRAGLQDPQARAQIANDRLLTGGISLNEYREEIGKPELENGDFFYIPGGLLPVPVDQIGTMQPKPSYLPFANPQVTIQQAGGLAEGSGIDVPPLPPPSTNPTGEEPAALANEGAQPQLSAPPAPLRSITVEAEVSKDTPVRSIAKASDGSPGGTALLKIGAAIRVEEVQTLLRQRLPEDARIRWTPSDSFHVTLVSSPLIDDTEYGVMLAREISSFIASEGIALSVEGLDVFEQDNMDVIILRVQSGDVLTSLQQDIVTSFIDANIEISEFSEPADWQPHITLAYMDKGIELPELTVEPFEVQALDLEFTRTAHNVEHSIAVRSITVEAEVSKDTPERELARWEKRALNKGAHKAAEFECYAIEPGHAELIAGELAHAEAGDKAAVKAIFQSARDRFAEKALQATRLDFEGDFEDLLIAARAENVNRRRFSVRLRTLLRKFGEKAYRDGLNDGGVEVGEDELLSDSDVATINRLSADQGSFVTDVGSTLFKGDGITDNMADGKPAQWFRGSIRPFYTAGLMSSDKNGMYGVTGTDGDDSCPDCQRLSPQRHRLRQWQKRNLILGTVGQSTECEGWECDHSLERTRGKAKGKF